MVFWVRWFLPIGIMVAIGLILYWQLVVAEGTYLGQHIVTWLYDLTASRYDSIKGFDDDLEDEFLGSPIAATLAAKALPLVLDIGIGTGRLPVTLLRQPDFRGRIIGIDDSIKMLRIAARRLEQYGDQVWLLRRNAMSLPFTDGSLDAVVALEMLEFTPAPPSVLQEAARVLSSGGLLVTTRRRGRDALLLPGKTHSLDEFSRLLTALGITEIQIEAWQVDYDLVWGRRRGTYSSASNSILNTIVCPQCRQVGLQRIEADLFCGNCGGVFKKAQGVVDFS